MVCENLLVSFIGAGRMGEALVAGLVRSGADPKHITAYDKDGTKTAALADAKGIAAAASAAEAADGADIVILAVKPKDIPGALKELKDSLSKDALIISIAAGVNIRTLERLLEPETRVVRVMPNGPAEKGAGMSAVAAGGHASDEDVAKACELFSSVGLVVAIDEALMNAVTAISGSGPAYFYLFVKALADAGVAEGLPPDVAYKLSHETMFGASRMLKYSKKSPEELIEGVRSPGGTTDAALKVFDAAGFESTVKEAVKTAARRGGELEDEIEKAAT